MLNLSPGVDGGGRGQQVDGENIFVKFFSATINHSHKIFGMQFQYGVPHCGVRFEVCCTSTSCLLTWCIFQLDDNLALSVFDPFYLKNIQIMFCLLWFNVRAAVFQLY